MEKIQAFFIHLTCSAAVVAAFLSVVSLIWYPSPYLEMSGAFNVIAVLVLVDIVLGPLLMLIIFKPGKPGLKTDIAVIVSMQVAAFLYGANAIYSQRPAYVVFVVDRFEVVSAADVKLSDAPARGLRAGMFSGPVLVYTNGPDDPVERGKILLEAAAGGPDVGNYPEYYKPYQDAVKTVLSRVKPVRYLIDSGGAREDTVRRVAHGFSLESVGFVPVMGRGKVMSMLVNPLTGFPMGAVDIEVW